MALWWVLVIVGSLVVIPLVAVLANRVVAPALEIDRYASDILEHGVGITVALEPVPALGQTAELVGATAGAATAYVVALERAQDGM